MREIRNTIIILWIVALGVLYVGCSKKPEPPPVVLHTISSRDIYLLMRQLDIPESGGYCLDAEYALPDKNWILNDF